jgi:hypothetical protein
MENSMKPFVLSVTTAGHLIIFGWPGLLDAFIVVPAGVALAHLNRGTKTIKFV